MGGFYELRRWSGFRYNNIHIKFFKDWLSHSKVNGGGGDIDTHRQHGDGTSQKVGWKCMLYKNEETVESLTGIVVVLCSFIQSSMSLQPFVVGLFGWGISPSQGRYLLTGQQEQNIKAQRSMPWVGFEPTIPEFERMKTVHALDRVATVIGSSSMYSV
jgi:hypothetical protein